MSCLLLLFLKCFPVFVSPPTQTQTPAPQLIFEKTQRISLPFDETYGPDPFAFQYGADGNTYFLNSQYGHEIVGFDLKGQGVVKRIPFGFPKMNESRSLQAFRYLAHDSIFMVFATSGGGNFFLDSALVRIDDSGRMLTAYANYGRLPVRYTGAESNSNPFFLVPDLFLNNLCVSEEGLLVPFTPIDHVDQQNPEQSENIPFAAFHSFDPGKPAIPVRFHFEQKKGVYFPTTMLYTRVTMDEQNRVFGAFGFSREIQVHDLRTDSAFRLPLTGLPFEAVRPIPYQKRWPSFDYTQPSLMRVKYDRFRKWIWLFFMVPYAKPDEPNYMKTYYYVIDEHLEKAAEGPLPDSVSWYHLDFTPQGMVTYNGRRTRANGGAYSFDLWEIREGTKPFDASVMKSDYVQMLEGWEGYLQSVNLPKKTQRLLFLPLEANCPACTIELMLGYLKNASQMSKEGTALVLAAHSGYDYRNFLKTYRIRFEDYPPGVVLDTLGHFRKYLSDAEQTNSIVYPGKPVRVVNDPDSLGCVFTAGKK